VGLAGAPVRRRGCSRKRGWLYVISCISRPLVVLPSECRPRPVQLDDPKAWIEPVLLVGDLERQGAPELSWSDGRYAVRFPYYRRNDLVAQHIADALDATLRLTHGPALFEPARSIGFPRALECSSSDVRHDHLMKPDCTRVVHRADLVAFDRLRNDDQTVGDLLIGSLLRDCFQVPRDELNAAFEMLPVTARAPYLQAVHFYRESIGDFYFSGDVIQTTLSNPKSAPASQLERAKAEAAVWSAFKALEAIIGDPEVYQNQSGTSRGRGTQAPAHSGLRVAARNGTHAEISQSCAWAQTCRSVPTNGCSSKEDSSGPMPAPVLRSGNE